MTDKDNFIEYVTKKHKYLEHVSAEIQQGNAVVTIVVDIGTGRPILHCLGLGVTGESFRAVLELALERLEKDGEEWNTYG